MTTSTTTITNPLADYRSAKFHESLMERKLEDVRRAKEQAVNDRISASKAAASAVKLIREEISTDRPLIAQNDCTRYRAMLGDICLGHVEGTAYCWEKTWAMYPAFNSEGQPSVSKSSYTYTHRAKALQALVNFVLPRLA